MVLEAWAPLRWEPQRTALTSLANVWLAEGATAVTISLDGIPVVTLPEGAMPAGALPAGRHAPDGIASHVNGPDANSADATGQTQLAAPIYWQGQLAGEIRIIGALNQGAQARVAAEAQLVGLLLETEADLASMTDELIQTQDHLLAVYDLGQLARRPMGLEERLFALAEAGGRLLNVEGAAVVMASDGKSRLDDGRSADGDVQGPWSPTAVTAQFPRGAQDEAWLLSLLPCLQVGDGAAGGPSADGAAPQSGPGAAYAAAVLWQGPGGPRAMGRRRRRFVGVQPLALPDRVNSLLMVPIGAPADGQVQAAFVFWSERHERFASPDTKLAHAIAEHAGVQIENALLQRDRIAQARLETEMQLARRVQTNLLPKALPRMPGLDLYACMRPASHVGGDFFDFVTDPGGSGRNSVVFLVSDVSGKGMSAAMVMTMTRTMVRTSLRSLAGRARELARAEHGHATVRGAAADLALAFPGPGALLSLANEELFQDLTELSMFATAFVAQYQHPSRRLVYANAGHSPVIFMPAGARPRLLEACCPPIGVMPTLQQVERTLTLRPGDWLVAASDGFNETRNAADEMFGLERMLRCVKEGAHLSAQAMGRALFAAVEAFRGGELQEDDQTLVIAKGT